MKRGENKITRMYEGCVSVRLSFGPWYIARVTDLDMRKGRWRLTSPRFCEDRRRASDLLTRRDWRRLVEQKSTYRGNREIALPILAQSGAKGKLRSRVCCSGWMMFPSPHWLPGRSRILYITPAIPSSWFFLFFSFSNITFDLYLDLRLRELKVM